MSDNDDQNNVVSLCKHREQTEREKIDFVDSYEITGDDAQAFLKVLLLLQSLSISETCKIEVDGEFIKFEVKHSLGSSEVEDTGIDTTDSGPLRFKFIMNTSGDISGMDAQIEPALPDPISFK